MFRKREKEQTIQRMKTKFLSKAGIPKELFMHWENVDYEFICSPEKEGHV